MDEDLVPNVARILAETGLAPQRLKLEITEGIVLENSESVVNVLNALRALGVQLGLDDFGTGYSALSYLRQFPFQTLKIDRSFVDGMQADGSSEIIRAIVSLADGLAMDVTAEGIETAEQVRDLRDLDCQFGQGYFFFKPLTKDDARAVLQSRGCITPSY
jgi:Amt family ammonium transporter